ncbi:hypothetical protein [Arthrobacter methylotrophus]|uniref:hypothetical protein n=1 Tax=Arthrobacter methylotrophus TaxID=121291 RepID=UPI0031E8B107
MAANLGASWKRLQGGFLHFFTVLHGASRGFMALRAASWRFARPHGASRRFIWSHMSPFFAPVDAP